jgi:hypothetical protein
MTIARPGVSERGQHADAGRHVQHGEEAWPMDGLVNAIMLIGGFLMVVWALRRANGARGSIWPPRDDVD